MRVLLSSYGSRGDIEPLVGLAVRLREHGASVRVCAPPDEDFARRLDGVGVPLVPVGPSAHELTVATPSPSQIPQRAAELIAGQLESVTGAARDCDVLVATGMLPAAAGALTVAELLGIPSVSVTFQQLTLPSLLRPPLEYAGRPHPPEVTGIRELWELDARVCDELFGDALNSNRTTVGLPPVDAVAGYVVGDRPWLATDPVLDPWQGAPHLDVVQTGAWLTEDERPLPDELLAFLDAGEPPVYVGFGSMPLHGAKDAGRAVTEAVRAQGRRLLLSRGWADLTAVATEEDCLVLGEVNHQRLFPRVAAVVHHGGAGTTTAAARAGVPQVVVAQAADQPYWAQRIAELGAGVAHDGPVPTATTLSTALDVALSAETRLGARELAPRIRTDGAERAAAALPAMAG
ncbi:glycosyltransferase [Streptomyces sp. XM4193]|uniref:glycosyltransferase n=1 Tax=Streptomyces sp. XM4193 TaxID=2929782 RepID=UPI001FFC1CFF|nr:glycosyltransferase [Streptomyces sp. XM4193]MCK1794899.1 glycosyltransferase [Streptomyces sp. XM4193]